MDEDDCEQRPRSSLVGEEGGCLSHDRSRGRGGKGKGMLNGIDLKGEGLLPSPFCLLGELHSHVVMPQLLFSTLFSQSPPIPPLTPLPTPSTQDLPLPHSHWL